MKYLGFRYSLIGRTPVIVYQMGKVGSLSVVRSLRAYGIAPVFHVHRLHPVNRAAMREVMLNRDWNEAPEATWIYRHILQQQRPAKFISLVREPVGRNVSAFFQNLEVITGLSREAAAHKADTLNTLFLKTYNHHVPLTWFDDELRETLGIDVYAQPFPKEQGYIELRNGPFELLVLRTELPDAEKAFAIQQYLDLRQFEIVRENESKHKWYADLYTHFKQNLGLPQDHIDAVCAAKYTQHFYSDREIEAIRLRWAHKSDHPAKEV